MIFPVLKLFHYPPIIIFPVLHIYCPPPSCLQVLPAIQVFENTILRNPAALEKSNISIWSNLSKCERKPLSTLNMIKTSSPRKQIRGGAIIIQNTKDYYLEVMRQHLVRSGPDSPMNCMENTLGSWFSPIKMFWMPLNHKPMKFLTTLSTSSMPVSDIFSHASKTYVGFTCWSHHSLPLIFF